MTSFYSPLMWNFTTRRLYHKQIFLFSGTKIVTKESSPPEKQVEPARPPDTPAKPRTISGLVAEQITNSNWLTNSLIYCIVELRKICIKGILILWACMPKGLNWNGLLNDHRLYLWTLNLIFRWSKWELAVHLHDIIDAQQFNNWTGVYLDVHRVFLNVEIFSHGFGDNFLLKFSKFSPPSYLFQNTNFVCWLSRSSYIF